MILADTSVWVSHLRKGTPTLTALLLNDEIICHPYIVGELACGNIKNRKEILNLLQALPMIPVITQDEFLRFVDVHSLMGRGIGYVDVHLLASSMLAGVQLWTEDKGLKQAAGKLKLNYTHQ